MQRIRISVRVCGGDGAPICARSGFGIEQGGTRVKGLMRGSWRGFSVISFCSFINGIHMYYQHIHSSFPFRQTFVSSYHRGIQPDT